MEYQSLKIRLFINKTNMAKWDEKKETRLNFLEKKWPEKEINIINLDDRLIKNEELTESIKPNYEIFKPFKSWKHRSNNWMDAKRE